MVNLEKYMRLAISEAELSLREGYSGYGAVIVKEDEIIASAHDFADNEDNIASYAEINAIISARKKLDNLSGCTLVTTHEPTSMCALEIVKSGIKSIFYGYSDGKSFPQDSEQTNLGLYEFLKEQNKEIKICSSVLEKECSILYRGDIRKEIKRLCNADDKILSELNVESAEKRTAWFHENLHRFEFISDDLLDSGYHLLLERFGITSDEAPVVQKTENQIVFHSVNFCPTLEACKILGLDTEYVCRRLNENSTDTLLKQLDKRLVFSRNYSKLRPNEEFCEEMISITDN